MKKELVINNSKESFDYSCDSSGQVLVTVGGEKFQFKKSEESSGATIWSTNKGHIKSWSCGGQISVGHRDFTIIDHKNQKRIKGSQNESGGMVSPMPGKILKVLVSVGALVDEGDPLIIMEAMKMEHTIKASENGKVISLNCKEGSLIDGGVILCAIKPLSKDK